MTAVERQHDRWYVILAYSGHEERTREEIIERLDHTGLSSRVSQLLVPTHEEVVMKNGKRHKERQTLYPGYIFLVTHEPDEHLFYQIRHTRGVTGFIGGLKPEPLPKEEIARMERQIAQRDEQQRISLKPGEHVRIADGPFADFTGVIEQLDPEHGKVRVVISFFDRNMPIDLDFLQIEKLAQA